MFLHSTCMRALIHLSSSRANSLLSLASALRSCHMTAWIPTWPRCTLMLPMFCAEVSRKSTVSSWASL